MSKDKRREIHSTSTIRKKNQEESRTYMKRIVKHQREDRDVSMRIIRLDWKYAPWCDVLPPSYRYKMTFRRQTLCSDVPIHPVRCEGSRGFNDKAPNTILIVSGTSMCIGPYL